MCSERKRVICIGFVACVGCCTVIIISDINSNCNSNSNGGKKFFMIDYDESFMQVLIK